LAFSRFAVPLEQYATAFRSHTSKKRLISKKDSIRLT